MVDWALEGRNVLADLLTERAAQRVGVPLSDALIARTRPRTREAFALQIELQHLLVERIVSRGWDMSKRERANGVFDAMILGSVGGPLAMLDGSPVVLVTVDGTVHEAAARALLDQTVLSVDAYRRLLDTTEDDLRAWLAERAAARDAAWERVRAVGTANGL